MRKGNLLFRLLAVLLVVMLGAAACGGRDDNDVDAGGEDDGGNEGGEPTAGPGFDGTTIKLGVLTPLSGPVADPIGLPLTAGGDVYWQRVNAEGGIAGKYKVEQVKEDTQYDAGKAREQYTKIKNDVVMFSQVLGTPPTQAILQDATTDKIALSPASLDAAWVREPNLLPVGTTYQLQFINAAAYLQENEEAAAEKMCLMAIEGEYGDTGVEGLEFAAEELDFEVGTTARFKATDQDFTAQIQQLKNADCTAVFLTALPSNTGKILGTGAQLGFTPRWVGQSPTWVSALGGAAALQPLLEKTWLWVSEGVTWGDTSVPGMKEMLDDIAEFKPDQKPDVYFVFGYVQARAVHALLEQAVESGDLSRDGILKAIEELEEVDYGGLLGQYTYGAPEDRSPTREATIFKFVNDPDKGYLEAVDQIESDAAKAFEFE